ncbi:aldolase, partial [Aureobasidium melanogenum]
LLSQRHLASLLGCVGKVVRQDHLVDVNSSDTPLDTLVQNLRDELVCTVQHNLHSAIDLLLDGFETENALISTRTMDILHTVIITMHISKRRSQEINPRSDKIVNLFSSSHHTFQLCSILDTVFATFNSAGLGFGSNAFGCDMSTMIESNMGVPSCFLSSAARLITSGSWAWSMWRVTGTEAAAHASAAAETKDGYHTEDTVFALGCCIEHAYGGVVIEFLECHCGDCCCLVVFVVLLMFEHINEVIAPLYTPPVFFPTIPRCPPWDFRIILPRGDCGCILKIRRMYSVISESSRFDEETIDKRVQALIITSRAVKVKSFPKSYSGEHACQIMLAGSCVNTDLAVSARPQTNGILSPRPVLSCFSVRSACCMTVEGAQRIHATIREAFSSTSTYFAHAKTPAPSSSIIVDEQFNILALGETGQGLGYTAAVTQADLVDRRLNTCLFEKGLQAVRAKLGHTKSSYQSVFVQLLDQFPGLQLVVHWLRRRFLGSSALDLVWTALALLVKLDEDGRLLRKCPRLRGRRPLQLYRIGRALHVGSCCSLASCFAPSKLSRRLQHGIAKRDKRKLAQGDITSSTQWIE